MEASGNSCTVATVALSPEPLQDEEGGLTVNTTFVKHLTKVDEAAAAMGGDWAVRVTLLLLLLYYSQA